MFRKLLIATVASLGLMSPLAMPVQSEAHEVQYHRHEYRVYVRDCNHEPWRFYGSYRFRDDASHAARHLRARGLEVFIR